MMRPLTGCDSLYPFTETIAAFLSTRKGWQTRLHAFDMLAQVTSRRHRLKTTRSTMNTATWTATGILSDLIEDTRNAEMHITTDNGIIVLFLRLNNESANAIAQSARNLVGERVTTSGTIVQNPENKLRSPYFLSPSSLTAA